MSTGRAATPARKIHPVVTNSYAGRILIYAIIAMMLLSALSDASVFARVAIIAFALVYPSVAYQVAFRAADSRRVGFGVFVVDGALLGLAIALLKFAFVPTLAILVSASATLYLLGGLWLLSIGFLPILIVATFLYPFVPVDPEYTANGMLLIWSAVLLSGMLSIIALMTNRVGRELASARRDLRLQREEVEKQAAMS